MFLMVGPQYIPHAIENLVGVVMMCALIAAPALLFVPAFGIELVAVSGCCVGRRGPVSPASSPVFRLC